MGLNGLTVPVHTRVLGPTTWDDVRVSRPGSSTLKLRAPRGLIQSPPSRLARERTFPMKLGEIVELAGMSAEVLAVTPNGQPSEVAFAFDVPLEDPSLVWIYHVGGGWVRFQPPRRGEHVKGRPPRSGVFSLECLSAKREDRLLDALAHAVARRREWSAAHAKTEIHGGPDAAPCRVRDRPNKDPQRPQLVVSRP